MQVQPVARVHALRLLELLTIEDLDVRREPGDLLPEPGEAPGGEAVVRQGAGGQAAGAGRRASRSFARPGPARQALAAFTTCRSSQTSSLAGSS